MLIKQILTTIRKALVRLLTGNHFYLKKGIAKKAELEKRSKLTSFISNELKSRQEEYPLVDIYIERDKAEPLHQNNNTIKERFMQILNMDITEQRKNQNKYCLSRLFPCPVLPHITTRVKFQQIWMIKV